MIAKLTGKLAYKSVESLILDVNGVGYQLFVPLSTFYKLPEVSDTVSLNTYLHVREDALLLYGFYSMDEKNLFLKLISVNGIGPRLAVNILSGISTADLINAIELQDVTKLTTIPGIGKKIGQRIALELKGKVSGLEGAGEEKPIGATPEKAKVNDDVVSALVNLGYKKIVAENALRAIIKGNPEEKSFEKLLKLTLNILSRA